MNLFKLVGSIFIDNEKANESLGKTDEKANKLGEAFVSGMKKVAMWSVALTTAVATGAIALTGMAADAETSFAKVSTLLDTQNTDISAYYDDIMKASSETGVAFDDFSEAVYSAISASVDQAEAVDFATQAIQLAKGGFTDAATAVDVLTTAINAYGLSADEATHLSDVLITTQNLGKTTVNELASSMGQVIPTASAYGVSMENLSAAYATLTKGGINTANSTTYLNQMLTELAKEGSNVGNILKEQTGQSFSELMNSGSSLGDVMDILYQSVGEDSVAFGNLWTSTTAAKGAMALANAGVAEFNDTLNAMKNSTGAAESAFETMEDTFEAKTEKIKVQFQNMGIEIGNSFLPVFKNVADIVLENMPVIQGMVEQITPIITDLMNQLLPPLIDLAATIFPKLVEIISVILPILTNMISTILPVGVQVLNMLLPAVVQIIATVLPALLELLSPLLDLLSPILSLLQPVLDIVVALIEPLTSLLVMQLEPIIEIVTYLLESILPVLTEALTWLSDFIVTILAPAISDGLNTNMDMITDFVNMFKILIDGVVTFISGTLDVIMGIVNVFISLCNGDFEAAGDALIQILLGLGKMVVGLLEAAFFNIIAMITSNFDQIKQFFTNFGSNISNFFSNLWNNSIADAKAKLSFLKDTISNILENAAGIVSGIVERMKGFFNFEFHVPGIKMPHFNISPTGWNLSKLLEGQIPQLGIEWYAKAMDNGMIMDKPTVFGINGNKLMAGGEAGSETVVGTMSLMEMIQGAVASQNQQLIAILEQILTAIITHDETLLDKMLTALESMRFEIRDREFARLVREVKA